MMKHLIQKHWFKAVVSILTLVIVAVVSTQILSARSTLPVTGRAPDFTLTSSYTGRPVHLKDTDGKVRLVTFLYTNCPDECPLTAGKMAQLQNQLKQKNLFGNKVVFQSITFDPTRDTAEQLNYYADKFHADRSGWDFLRGTQEQTDSVIQGFGVSVVKDADQYEHLMKTYLIDQNGNIRKAYGIGEDMNVDQVMNDIQSLTK